MSLNVAGLTKFESTAGHYESLGDQDKPRFYEAITTREDQS